MKSFYAFDNQDIKVLENFTHKDFVHVDDYEMVSRQEWLEGLRGLFESRNTPDFTRDRTVIADHRDVFSMQFTREIEGISYRITKVASKRDRKFWHFQANCVTV